MEILYFISVHVFHVRKYLQFYMKFSIVKTVLLVPFVIIGCIFRLEE